jgi:hypothetical protein
MGIHARYTFTLALPGFRQAMDTTRDRVVLQELWTSEEGPPWKVW